MRLPLFVATVFVLLSPETFAENEIPLAFRGVPMNASEREFLEKNPDFGCKDAVTEKEKEWADRICFAEDKEETRTYVIKGAKEIKIEFIGDKLKRVAIEFAFPSGGAISSTKSAINMYDAIFPISAALREKFGQGEKNGKDVWTYKADGGTVQTFKIESAMTGTPSKYFIWYATNDYNDLINERKRPRIQESMKGM